MSDYISKNEVIELLYKTFDEYSMGTDKHNSLGGFGAEVFKRVKELQTVSEKEIIRNTVERIVERLEENALGGVMGPQLIPIKSAIKIVKEEGGIE